MCKLTERGSETERDGVRDEKGMGGELEQSGQWQEANKVHNIMGDTDCWFVKIVPASQQTDQIVSTE